MRPPLLHWLLCTGLVAGAMLGIGFLRANDARAAPVSLPDGSPLKCVPDEHTLCIHYLDFSKRAHQFGCPMELRRAREVEESFGYPLKGKNVQQELDRRLKIEIGRQAGGIAPYLNISIDPHGDPSPSEAPVPWMYKHPISFKDNLPVDLHAKALEIRQTIIDNLKQTKQAIYDNYYAEKGFWKGPLHDKEGRPEYEVTYKRFADQARPLLKKCFDEFARQAGAGDDQEVMSLLSALFQEIPLEPPKNEKGLYKGGFRTPMAVLDRDRGDCDSKSVALSSLWRSPGPQMILLLADLTEEEKASVPQELRASQHAFLGYQSNAGRGTVRAGLLHYVLYEASRPLDPAAERVLPGKSLVSSPPRRGICLTDDCCGFGESNCRVYKDS